MTGGSNFENAEVETGCLIWVERGKVRCSSDKRTDREVNKRASISHGERHRTDRSFLGIGCWSRGRDVQSRSMKNDKLVKPKVKVKSEFLYVREHTDGCNLTSLGWSKRLIIGETLGISYPGWRRLLISSIHIFVPVHHISSCIQTLFVVGHKMNIMWLT